MLVDTSLSLKRNSRVLTFLAQKISLPLVSTISCGIHLFYLLKAVGGSMHENLEFLEGT